MKTTSRKPFKTCVHSCALSYERRVLRERLVVYRTTVPGQTWVSPKFSANTTTWHGHVQVPLCNPARACLDPRTRERVDACLCESPSRLTDCPPFSSVLRLCGKCMCHAVSGRTRTHWSGDRRLSSHFSGAAATLVRDIALVITQSHLWKLWSDSEREKKTRTQHCKTKDQHHKNSTDKNTGQRQR